MKAERKGKELESYNPRWKDFFKNKKMSKEGKIYSGKVFDKVKNIHPAKAFLKPQ